MTSLAQSSLANEQILRSSSVHLLLSTFHGRYTSSISYGFHSEDLVAPSFPGCGCLHVTAKGSVNEAKDAMINPFADPKVGMCQVQQYSNNNDDGKSMASHVATLTGSHSEDIARRRVSPPSTVGNGHMGVLVCTSSFERHTAL